jgi:TRAP-type C4-dicarboxylate transport system permease large subunit
MAQITRAAVPIVICHLVVMALLIFVPPLSLWLPGLMAK